MSQWSRIRTHTNGMPMYKVGLTGGIGSGKSTVADIFAQQGIEIIDADLIAREVVAPGSATLNRVCEAFGQDVCDAEGKLNRATLRAIIFGDRAERLRLEAILHPPILQRMFARAEAATGSYCVLVMPLLVEARQQHAVDRVVVVDCDEALQRKRALARDQMSGTEFDRILAAQASRQQRLAVADDVIVNDGDLRHLETQVKTLHQRILRHTAV